MKKATLLFWMTIIYTGIVIGQDPEPVKPCIFVNNEGKVYYNRILPVYFWISNSPEENAPAYRLTSEQANRREGWQAGKRAG